MTGYTVGHWFLWGDRELRKKTYRYDSYELALDRFNKCSQIPGTTRVVLRKRDRRRSSTALGVWESDL